jgi:eukaryotic-like serine/threonine-protein kinase
MVTHALELMEGGRIPVDTAGIDEVELEELLGIGGFGSAWRAVHRRTGRRFVLKVIQGLKPGGVVAERVRMEAEVSIPSEYIVPPVGLREWDPNTFLILFEHFESTSLDKLLDARLLPPDQRKQIFEQVLAGVSDAHRCNVIHRDLKPANILVDRENQVKLIDFGLAKFKEKGITISGEVFGTECYMAIELLVEGAGTADARADIFSLGHVLYELAMGRHFWARRRWTGLSDLVEYLNRVPRPSEAIDLSDFACSFYPDVRPVLAKMVKIDREQRYHSVDEVMEALGHAPRMVEAPKDIHLRYPLLIVESGSNRGARTLVNIDDGRQLEFGRMEIAGSDTSISRKHLEFNRRGDQYFVRDVGSMKGTLVGGVELIRGGEPVELKHGDRIKVGDVFLRFAFLRAP